KSHTTRLVVRRFSQHLVAQLVAYAPQGDKILLSVDSRQLTQHGWTVHNGNIPEAYLTGLLLAQKAKPLKLTSVIVDDGLYKHIAGSRLYALLRGAVEGGLSVAHDESVLASDERVQGQHIAQYAQTLVKEDKARYEKQFS